MTLRLAAFVTHPVQYMAPLWRRLAEEPELSLRVHVSRYSTEAGAEGIFRALRSFP